MRILLSIIALSFVFSINAQKKENISQKKNTPTNYDNRYYNGYEHDLSEPDWEKLKNINEGIGATRDIDGNYYFYQYNSGYIIKCNKDLNTKVTLNQAISSYYRIAPRIVPLDYGTILLRKPYHIGHETMTGIYLDGVMPEAIVAPWITTISTNALTFDYDRRLLYHGAQILDSDLQFISRFHDGDTYRYPGIIYWGKKYKWVASLPDKDGDKNMTFYAYKQSKKGELLSTEKKIIEITVPGFAISNGALVNVYEYNDKLVVVRFGGSAGVSSYGSILILDPTGRMGAYYKIYEHNDALWRSSIKNDHMCGGIYWKHKMMVYDEQHNKYYFEFPELLK
jgi:hypothetical protein